jgi:hypothetical protein
MSAKDSKETTEASSADKNKPRRTIKMDKQQLAESVSSGLDVKPTKSLDVVKVMRRVND